LVSFRYSLDLAQKFWLSCKKIFISTSDTSKKAAEHTAVRPFVKSVVDIFLCTFRSYFYIKSHNVKHLVAFYLPRAKCCSVSQADMRELLLKLDSTILKMAENVACWRVYQKKWQQKWHKSKMGETTFPRRSPTASLLVVIFQDKFRLDLFKTRVRVEICQKNIRNKQHYCFSRILSNW